MAKKVIDTQAVDLDKNSIGRKGEMNCTYASGDFGDLPVVIGVGIGGEGDALLSDLGK